MKRHIKIFPLALGTVCLLSLILLFAPWSLFSQNSSPPSPDFDRNGVVGIPDFLLFVSAFGAQEGQDKYESQYDLDGNGEIGIPDFLIFVDNFGKAVKRLPPTCMPTSAQLHPNVTLSDRSRTIPANTCGGGQRHRRPLRAGHAHPAPATIGTRIAGQCSNTIIRIYRRKPPRSWCL